MLSTSDNPYNPWTQWDEWYEWDESHGYRTTAYVGRIAYMLSLSGIAQEEAERLAIKDIIDVNLTGNYILVPEPK